jgi:hypothetical protein
MPIIFTFCCAFFAFLGSTAIRWETHTERWLVKTMTDRDTVGVMLGAPILTTVSQQAHLPAVAVSQYTGRLRSECSELLLDAYLLGAKLELDGDYHLILGDPEKKATIIAEIPDDEPAGVHQSSRAQAYRQARQTIDSFIIPPADSMYFFRPPIRVQVTGIGFYDVPHAIAQEAQSTNSREIHPVLSIQLLPK